MGIVISFVVGAFLGALAYFLISNGLIKKIEKDIVGKV